MALPAMNGYGMIYTSIGYNNLYTHLAIDPNFRLLGHPRPQGGLPALYSGAGVRVSTGQRFSQKTTQHTTHTFKTLEIHH